MLRTLGKIFGGTLAMLCLVSTLAIAQSQSSSWSHTTQLPPVQAQRQKQAIEFITI